MGRGSKRYWGRGVKLWGREDGRRSGEGRGEQMRANKGERVTGRRVMWKSKGERQGIKWKGRVKGEGKRE